MFKQLDTNQNGTLQKFEIKDALAKMGLAVDDATLDAAWKEADVDEDGRNPHSHSSAPLVPRRVCAHTRLCFSPWTVQQTT